MANGGCYSDFMQWLGARGFGSDMAGCTATLSQEWVVVKVPQNQIEVQCSESVEIDKEEI